MVDKHFRKIKLAVDETLAVSEVHGRCKLDSDIVSELEIVAGDVHTQVEVEFFNVLVHVAAVGHFGHNKLGSSVGVDELVECSYNVGVGLDINPFLYIFVVRNFLKEKLLTEVLVVHNEGRLVDNAFNLKTAVH